MDKTSEVFIEVVKNYIHGIECRDIDFSGIDWGKFNHLIQSQNLDAIFYSCLKDCDIDKDCMERIKKTFFQMIAYYQIRLAGVEKLKRLFQENDIDMVVVKGIYIASFYPNPEMRGMGDVDILIREADRERSHQVLLQAGAMHEAKKNNGDIVWAYKFQNVSFEVHTNLVANKNIINQVDYHGYFAKAIEHTKQTDKNIYVLDEDFNMIYTIYHISKHFRFSGCGVRMLLDLPILINDSGCTFSWDYIWQELDRLKIKEFTYKIFKLCEEWFGALNVEYPRDFEIPQKELLEQFILNGGVFGLEGRSTDSFVIRSFGNKEEGGYNYFKGMLKWAFPSCEKMRQYSKWFQDKPAVLLPVAYALRFAENAKERGGVLNWSKKISKGKKDLDEKQIMLSIMELE